MSRRAFRAALAAGALALLPVGASAQISPGPLARAHAKLDGSRHCLDCHDPQKGVARSKCLACHEALRRRVASGLGLHARPEYGDCKTCHVEHQGADFQLVWWGRQGRAAFDHGLTGQPLAGKHARLDCQQCHKTRSYLGTATACASCHEDEHRGQFAGRTCTACHTQDAWKPAPGFDHAKTAWPLTGRHAAAACERCHANRRSDPASPGTTYRVFRGVAGTDCGSCHRDTHEGRLGRDCARCHSTSSWRDKVRTTGFDHAKTAYPLAGRHSTVACEKCHLPGRPLRVAHDRCAACHADAHDAKLAGRPELARCESCHDVSGFRPVRFGVDEHGRTAYPLTGAHLAVACDRCHHVPGTGRSPGTLPLHIAATRCADCHDDPHRVAASPVAARQGCEGCHRVESWRQVAFDHGKTTWALAGRHAKVACSGCHRAAHPGRLAPQAQGALRFAEAPRTCEGCHADPHRGQFASAGRSTSCERCHTTDTVAATRFDHQRDSAYPLDGAHRRVACAACHRPETHDGVRFVRYKPLPTACAGCHRGERKPPNGERP